MKAELSFPIFFIAIQCRMIWNLYYAIFISPDFKLHVRCTRLQRKCTIKCTVDVCKLNMVVVYFSGLRRKHRTRNLSQFGNTITDEKILSHYKYRLGVYLLKQSLETLSKYISAKPGNHSSSELQLYITRCLSHYNSIHWLILLKQSLGDYLLKQNCVLITLNWTSIADQFLVKA